MVYNGKLTRNWMSREETASPTASLENAMLLAMLDGYGGRDINVANVPIAFIQTQLLIINENNEKKIMKITGVLVDIY